MNKYIAAIKHRELDKCRLFYKILLCPLMMGLPVRPFSFSLQAQSGSYIIQRESLDKGFAVIRKYFFIKCQDISDLSGKPLLRKIHVLSRLDQFSHMIHKQKAFVCEITLIYRNKFKVFFQKPVNKIFLNHLLFPYYSLI